jgi:hypothetical protein
MHSDVAMHRLACFLSCGMASSCKLLVLHTNATQYGTAHVQNSTVPVLGGSDLRCAALQTPCHDLWMLQVWQVRASYDAKPYRKTMMQLWCELGGGGRVRGKGCRCVSPRGTRGKDHTYICTLHHSAMEYSM